MSFNPHTMHAQYMCSTGQNSTLQYKYGYTGHVVTMFSAKLMLYRTDTLQYTACTGQQSTVLLKCTAAEHCTVSFHRCTCNSAEPHLASYTAHKCCTKLSNLITVRRRMMQDTSQIGPSQQDNKPTRIGCFKQNGPSL